jgi:hypothetical protein
MTPDGSACRRRDDRLKYYFTHEIGHLVFSANDQALQFRWAAWFWSGNVPRGQLSGYSARVLAAGDWWQAAKEDAADSYAAMFTGDPLDTGRRSWLCIHVDGLATLLACNEQDGMARIVSIR